MSSTMTDIGRVDCLHSEAARIEQSSSSTRKLTYVQRDEVVTFLYYGHHKNYPADDSDSKFATVAVIMTSVGDIGYLYHEELEQL